MLDCEYLEKINRVSGTEIAESLCLGFSCGVPRVILQRYQAV